jgi:hypothetical protein
MLLLSLIDTSREKIFARRADFSTIGTAENEGYKLRL